MVKHKNHHDRRGIKGIPEVCSEECLKEAKEVIKQIKRDRDDAEHEEVIEAGSEVAEAESNEEEIEVAVEETEIEQENINEESI